MLKRKSKKPNIYWHIIDSDDFLRTSTLPLVYIDIFGYRHERYNNRRREDKLRENFGNTFNYSFYEFSIRLGSSLFGKNILEINLISNQQEMLKYMHQEWSGPKTFIKGVLLK